MKNTFLSTFLIGLVLIISTTAHCAELIVGISSGYPPYYFKEEGQLTGLCIDLVNAAARKLNIEISYREYPWKRLLTSAQKGSVDAIMPLFRTEEREKYLIFDGLGLSPENIHFFVPVHSQISYSGDLANLKSQRIGVVSNYSYGSKFDSYTGFAKVETNDEIHLLEMLQHKRFDVGVGNKDVISYFAKEKGLGKSIKFLEPELTKDMLYIGFTKIKNHKELSTQFANALREIKNSSGYQSILSKYQISD